LDKFIERLKILNLILKDYFRFKMSLANHLKRGIRSICAKNIGKNICLKLKDSLIQGAYVPKLTLEPFITLSDRNGTN